MTSPAISPIKGSLLGLILFFFPLSCGSLVVYLSTKPLESPFVNLAAPDFQSIEMIDERKAAFFDFFTPLVWEQNQRLRRNRDLLLSLNRHLRQHGKLPKYGEATIQRLAERYEIPLHDLSVEEQLAMLLRRVDEIPPSLVLAQAASESAWGTSRFAMDGNNYFGQWCFSEGCGLVPKQRAQGARHEVAAFATPRASIMAYFRNINTHEAYKPLREIRSRLRAEGKPITSEALVNGLGSYSERGQEYINELRQIIHGNHLTERDV